MKVFRNLLIIQDIIFITLNEMFFKEATIGSTLSANQELMKDSSNI